jgi:hypothetical protein
MTKDQFDWDIPDAYIVISDFDKKPSDVNGKGFAHFVAGPKVPTQMAMDMVLFLRAARRLLRGEFKTIKEMSDSRDEAMPALSGEIEKYGFDEGMARWRKNITDRQRIAFVYSNFTRELTKAHTPATPAEEKLQALAAALRTLWIWQTEGPAAAEKAQSERNSVNASRPRPRSGPDEADEVLLAFKRLCAVGYTASEARGRLVKRGDMGSQSKIYKITKDK